jgi:hypothetical protein
MSCDDFYFAGRSMNMRVSDELRQAEGRGLARLALAGRERSHNFYCDALGWLGTRLVTWGSHLEERYSSSISAPVPQSANHLTS